jgi:hypothetical protein
MAENPPKDMRNLVRNAAGQNALSNITKPAASAIAGNAKAK